MDDDPPAHYPKPGHGLARTLPPESEDLPWLVDDNFEVFSHSWKGGPGKMDSNGKAVVGAVGAVSLVKTVRSVAGGEKAKANGNRMADTTAGAREAVQRGRTAAKKL